MFTIPLSTEGEEVRRRISVLIQLRPHVSYRREFLDSYEPNKTFYLSQTVIKKLYTLGAGTERGRPSGRYARKIYQRFLIDLSRNSGRLEGNTYSLLETERLLAAEDRNRFVEVAETEVFGLHEGNFARFKIRPSEFFSWQNLWK